MKQPKLNRFAPFEKRGGTSGVGGNSSVSANQASQSNFTSSNNTANTPAGRAIANSGGRQTGTHTDFPSVDEVAGLSGGESLSQLIAKTDVAVRSVGNVVAAKLNLSEAEGKDIVSALRKFTGMGFSDIRAVERSGQTNSTIENINKFIELAPKFNGQVFRGLNFETETLRNQFVDSLVRAGGIQLDAMSSYSSSRKVADSFADEGRAGVVLQVLANRSGASIKYASSFLEEDEVLAPRGATYRLLKLPTTDTAGRIIIQLEEIT